MCGILLSNYETQEDNILAAFFSTFTICYNRNAGILNFGGIPHMKIGNF